MATVALQQVSSTFARANAGRTLEKPVAVRYVIPYLGPDELVLVEEMSAGGGVFAWGSKFERHHQAWKVLPKQCLMLFRRGNTIFKVGVIALQLKNEALAEKLWGRDADGQTWTLVYLFAKMFDVAIPVKTVNDLLGYLSSNHWQGLVVVDTDEAERVIEVVKEVVRSNKSLERT